MPILRRLTAVLFLALLFGITGPVPSANAMGRRIVFKGLSSTELEEQSKARTFFLAAAAEIPKKLQMLGVTRLSTIKLDDFLAQLPRIQVEYFGGLHVRGGGPAGERREGGANYARGQRVRFSDESVLETKNTDLFPAFALHEALEALGFKDDFYSISFGMYLATRLDPLIARSLIAVWNASPRTIPSDREFLQLRSPSLAGGGASGVGKGGDTIVLRIRAWVFERFRRDLELKHLPADEAEIETMKFVTRLNWIDIEDAPGFPPSTFRICTEDLPFVEEGSPRSSNYRVLVYRNIFELMADMPDYSSNESCRSSFDFAIQALTDRIREIPPHDGATN